MRCPLTYKVISECSTTKARVGLISLVHSNVDTPVSLIIQIEMLAVWLDFSCNREYNTIFQSFKFCII